MSFKVKNLSAFPTPLQQESLKSIETVINSAHAVAGVNAGGSMPPPQNPGSIAVAQANGIYDVTINDPAAARGETYFVEWDTQSSFGTARMIQLGAARHWRGTFGDVGNTWWRFYKQVQGSDPSPWINFSGTPVAGGGAAGPAVGVPLGSGSSKQSGRGFGNIGS